MEKIFSNLIKRLSKNNISALYVENRHLAFDEIISMIPEGSIVGFGDSLTIRQIGIVDALEKGNYTFLNPWMPGISIEESIELKKRSLTSDVFITGTNALTLDGKIVNIDGHGNRVSAMLFGPNKVIIAVGVNKIVENLEKALWKIKNKTAPLNVKYHSNFNPMPPCGITGVCSDCSAPWRICNKTVIIEKEYNNDRYKPIITIVIINEKLGI